MAVNDPNYPIQNNASWLDEEDEEKKTVGEKLRNGAARTVIATAFYPLRNVKTLIQLGYEPLELQHGRRWYIAGRDTYFLPNAFSYASYLKQQEGLSGLFTGVAPCIVGHIASLGVGIYAQLYVDKKWPKLGGHLEFDEERQMSELDVDDRQSLRRAVRSVVRQSVVRTVTSVAARPFQVIAIRQVAQLIHGETTYVGVIESFSLIYKEEGAKGLFAGLFAQLIGDLALLWTLHGITYLAERTFVKYIAESRQEEIEAEDADQARESDEKVLQQLRRFVDFAAPFALSSYFYPFQVVATVMAINGCGLKAGSLPFVAQFDTWQDCYRSLAERGQLMRGAKMFLRMYGGPVTYKNNMLMAKIQQSPVLIKEF